MNFQPPQEGDKYYGQSQAVPAGQMRATKLSACIKCNAVHPWARNPIVYTWDCPDCGHPCAPPQTQIVKLRLPGVLGWVVDVCYGFADYLNRQAERLRK